MGASDALTSTVLTSLFCTPGYINARPVFEYPPRKVQLLIKLGACPFTSAAADQGTARIIQTANRTRQGALIKRQDLIVLRRGSPRIYSVSGLPNRRGTEKRTQTSDIVYDEEVALEDPMESVLVFFQASPLHALGVFVIALIFLVAIGKRLLSLALWVGLALATYVGYLIFTDHTPNEVVQRAADVAETAFKKGRQVLE
jgi:hypothetical protein